VMYGGRIMEQAGVVDAFYRPSNPYTQGLLRSMPSAATAELYSIPGQPPVPGSYPEGCRFHPRCPYCIDECKEGVIALADISSTQQSRCVRAGDLELNDAPPPSDRRDGPGDGDGP
jgi:peptide/nickel transport system ATP-binding protein